MANPNIRHLITDAFEQALEETPAIGYTHAFDDLLGLRRMTYRERLDEQPFNSVGRLIPRIVTVRRNLRAFKAGNTQVWRGLNVRDRRQQKGRRRADAHD